MSKFEFICGCKLDRLDVNHLSDCAATWDLICEGNTVGVFQLENPLGQTWARRTKPRTIEELSDLVALLRPGCLESGMSDKYVRTKRGEIEIEYLHEALRPIFESTYGVLTYQEQAIKVAQSIAGFNLIESDSLRKAMGKKDTEEMAKVKTKFVAGCEKTKIVSKEVAAEIFGWIEKSQRYSFNKAHSVAYAKNAYICAYLKQHFPLQFFCSYLEYAEDKIKPREEIARLVSNAQSMNINVLPPCLLHRNRQFEIQGNHIRFGLGYVKNIGIAASKKLDKIILDSERLLNKPLSQFSWKEWLLNVGLNINSKCAEYLIYSGAMGWVSVTRRQMIFEFQKLSTLTEKELQFIKNLPNDNLVWCIQECGGEHGGAANKNRKAYLMNLAQILQKPPYDLSDSATSLAQFEILALGVGLSSHAVEDFDKDNILHNCSEVKNLHENIILGVTIDDVRVYLTKNGKNKGAEMAFMKVSDETGRLDNIVIFPEQWAEFRHLLVLENKVGLVCTKSSKNDGLIVNRVAQLEMCGI